MTEITITRRDYYHMRKAAHICTKCGREDAYTMAGRSRCYECQARERLRQRERAPEERAAKNAASKRRYRDRIAAGLCGICGKRPLADDSKCYCEWCRAKNRTKCQNVRRSIGVLSNDEYFELGLCYRCGKAPHLGGQKLCKKCSDLLAQARAKVDPEKRAPAFRRENDLFLQIKKGVKDGSQSNAAAG